jgi:hypothetical protein
MQAIKILTQQKPIPETKNMLFRFNMEALKNTTLGGLQRQLGKSAGDLKSIIEKIWLD